MACKCDLMDRLTAEQHDRSYLGVIEKPKRAPRSKPFKTSQQEQDERDTLMFNAGRYSAGARDVAAEKANAIFQIMMAS